MNNHTFIPCADNLHACLVGAWDEKERKRVAKKKKDHKGDAPFLEEVKPYDGKWKPLHFLTLLSSWASTLPQSLEASSGEWSY